MDISTINTRRGLFMALHEQYRKKNAAYGNSAHKTFEMWGETAYLVRISDKLNRMNQLLDAPQTDDIGESLLDTIGDAITYMIMLLADCIARDYAVNGKTYESAIEDEFRVFEEGHEMETLYIGINIELLRKVWTVQPLSERYHRLRDVIASLAALWLQEKEFLEFSKDDGAEGKTDAT